VKPRRWKLGPVQVEVEKQAEQQPVVPVEPGQPRRKASRALWNQPIERQLLMAPAIVALVWWRWAGFSGWSWLVPLLAVVPTLIFLRAVNRADDREAN